GQLAQLIPRLLQGLKQGLASIQYPEDRSELFFGQLFALHQGGIKAVSPARDLQALQSVASTWLAPTEARASGFMAFPGADEPEKGGDSPATVPAGLAPEPMPEFAATVPMELVDRGSAPPQDPLATSAPDELSLDQLQ